MAPVDSGATLVPLRGASEFAVRQFQPADREQVVATFLEGMSAYSEYAHNETQNDYIRSSLESDLSDIHGTYVTLGGNFWVVTPTDDPSRIVGMVGIELKAIKEGELRRMSVRRGFRRHGIARLLLDTLEAWAIAQGFETLWLTTAAMMKPAHAFYESAGFSRVEEIRLADDFSVFKYEKPLASV
jgi:putative acetyltransferase